MASPLFSTATERENPPVTDTDRTAHPPENLAEASAAGPPAAPGRPSCFVHGLWMTPRSWQGWVAHYEQQGLTVLAPGYPGFEIEVEGLRENPQLIADLTVPETLDHLASVIEALDAPPIIMGHSFGGTLTQLLLARGLGAAGVVIDSAPTEGVRVSPVSQARSLFPALRNPANRHRAVGVSARGVPLRVHEHAQRGGVARGVGAVRELPLPGHWV